MSQQFQINPILQRLSDADSDFRFMALNDLHSLVTSSSNTLSNDTGTTARLIDGVVKALDDSNGEVQNLAVKCLAPLSLKIKDSQLTSLLEKLAELTLTSNDPSIPATALRLVIGSLPKYMGGAPGVTAPSATTTPQVSIQRVVIPKLLVMLKAEQDKSSSSQHGGGVSIDMVDVLIEVLRCFGDTVSQHDLEKLQAALLGLVESDRCSSVVKKRAVTALASLGIYASDGLLSNIVSHLIMAFRASHITPNKQRLLVSTAGALSRSTPKRFGPYLKTLAPFVLALVDGHDLERDEDDSEPQTEQDEVREAALAALESFLAHCPVQMKSFTEEVIAAGLRFLKYDPNYAVDDEEADEEMGGTQQDDDDDDDDAGNLDDEEFEDDAFSDDDDISWKVRRGAAKLLSTIISTRAEDLLKETLYREVAPSLVKRFSEREENVRLEVLATTTTLIRKTRDLAYSGSTPAQRTASAKKRRRGSDISMYEQEKMAMQPPEQPSASYALQKLSPELAKSSARLLKNPSLNTKQTTVDLLSSLITALPDPNATLTTVLESIVNIVAASESRSVAPASAAASGSAAASSSSLRIESLKFLSTAFVEGGDEALKPFISKIVQAVAIAAKDKFYKISSQALATASEMLSLLAAEMALEDVSCFNTLFDAIVSKIQQNDTDLEVRERAIEAMGSLLAVTSGTKYLDQGSRDMAFTLLLERLRNETTRLTTVRAIEKLAQEAQPDDLPAAWVKDVISELGAQLRKANRALRGSSLVALRALVLNPAVQPTLSSATAEELVTVLTPLLQSSDLHLCGPALQILSVLIESGINLKAENIQSIAELGQNPLSGGPLEALLGLVKSATVKGQGDEILKQYLNLGVSGNTVVVAKVIGRILASGADSGQGLSVSLASFVSEIKNSSDDKRKGLALMVLGEAGLNGHGEFSLGPEIFVEQLRSPSEELPLAAATALGLAGVGNPQQFVPAIIKEFAQGTSKDQYLLLHSYKEILQHSVQKPENIGEFGSEIWEHLFSAAKHDESKSIAAECVGRLVIIDPGTYIPGLQQRLGDPDPAARAVVISALRYTFTDTTGSFDAYLKPVVADLLVAMLNDPSLDNRKLALTALNSAAHNKANLVKANLSSLLPLVYQETVIKPELIREVQMGPFKHKVDDGLELRKSAYDTLYALIETSYARMNPSQIYERIVAGVGDEHEVQIICNLMLGKLVAIGKEDIIKRLDSIAEKYKATLSIRAKDNAVKQELEKMTELNRSILRTTLTIQSHVGTGANREQAWVAYHDWVKSNHGAEMASLEKEEAKAAKGVGI
ncbi:hypothetical protein DRE_01835 [Drechslerella stenobrocha 248]|uniref:TATA-binding protein interacting (TIP20) domain-containing protein n=1 Tax=Drechslerella stenobrocha 248 TaxID=1043628 RepID=W7I8I5_9PEZI|nr:hypothetical protein DRE_01835 [Drechslerella stenobrocha 248]